MPRGPVVYTLPPGTTPQIAGTTIEPAIFNAAMDDIANTFNTIQPPEYGGTGGASPAEAREKLGLEIGVNVSAIPRGHIYGLAISNNATDAVNDIDIAPGQAASDVVSPVMMTLAASITKRMDAAWTVGSGNGGWLDGASMPNGTGHVFLIQRPDTGVVDVGVSASLSPTLPTNYTVKRRIGSILRESGSVVGFIQNGDFFRRKLHLDEVSVTNLGTTPTTYTLAVPLGLALLVDLNVSTQGGIGGTAGTTIAVFSTDETTFAASPGSARNTIATTSNNGVRQAGFTRIVTNTSGQFVAVANTANTQFAASVAGWTDTRGRT